MRINDILKEDGVIVPGVNTTDDVKPGETERQAAKYFGHGKPKELHAKARKNSDPNKLYNLGLAESEEIVWERDIRQSDPMTVLNKVMARKDNSPFPVRMYDGSTIAVSPRLAKSIVDVYDNLEPEKKKKVELFLKTKNGFKELAQLVGNMSKVSIAGLKEAVMEHIEK